MLQRSEKGVAKLNACFWAQRWMEKGNKKMNNEILELIPNQPQHVAIKYAQPKIVSNGRAMFSLVSGQLLFVDPPVAQKIVELGVRTGEPFAICLRWNGKKTAPKNYEVWRDSDEAQPYGCDDDEPDAHEPEYGSQPDGTYSVPAVPAQSLLERQLRASIEQARSSSPSTQHPAPSTQQQWAAQLCDATNMLVDVFAQCCKNARERHAGLVSNDDVRAILMNRLIEGARR